MGYTRSSISILLVLPMLACQSSPTSSQPPVVNDHQTVAVQVVEAPGVKAPPIEKNAVQMEYKIFKEIINQLPEEDKFGGFGEKYTSLINQYGGVYYSDVVLSKWNQSSSTYDLPYVMLKTVKPKQAHYTGVNGYGAKFKVLRMVFQDDRIAFNNPDLASIPVSEARELDGSTARIYYKLNNKGYYSNSSGDFAEYRHEICREKIKPKVTTQYPFELLDHGCQINGDVLKVVALKTNKELKLAEAKSFRVYSDNYSINQRALDVLK
ncbi:TPA: hypothetical protein ACSP0J_003977 [Aeromonas veronii]|uniref:hypothetical protein n=1 Tax=Aeromonas TaxID=642 RepID=UPI0022E49246|nr:hypothetical protein [Aeromonas sp. Y311-2]EKP0314292.1 hypothetical protein [Aeromonas veronii]